MVATSWKIELSLCEPHEESFKKIKKQNFKIIDKAFGVEQKKNNIFTKHARPNAQV